MSQTAKPESLSCRIYGVLLRGREVLLTRSVFRAPERTIEFVNFPGGGIEPGEAPMEALRREYQEETGMAVKPVRVLYASEAYHRSSHRPLQIVSIFWLVEPLSGEPRGTGNGDDILQLFWAPLDRIPTDEMFPSDLEFARLLPGFVKGPIPQ